MTTMAIINRIFMGSSYMLGISIRLHLHILFLSMLTITTGKKIFCGVGFRGVPDLGSEATLRFSAQGLPLAVWNHMGQGI